MAGGAGDLLPVGAADPLGLLVEVVGVAEAVPGGGEERDGDVGPGQEVLHVLGEVVHVPRTSSQVTLLRYMSIRIKCLSSSTLNYSHRGPMIEI